MLTAHPTAAPSSNVPLVAVSPERRDGRAVATRHVLHLINGEHFAGAERVQLHLARRLPELGYVTDFVSVKPGMFREHFDVEQGQLFDAPMRGRFDLGIARRVARIARDQSSQLLHAHTPRTAVVAAIASRLTGLPWVYHVHSPAARDSAKPWANRINDWCERLSLWNCAHQITVSRSLRNEVVRHGWPEDQVTLVHNGVPAIRVQRTRGTPSTGTWTLGMVALMRPRKGVEVLLDAVRCAIDSGLDIRLRCIGAFETEAYEASVLSRVESLRLKPYVDFVGFTRDIPAALAEIDALVLPSLFGEGLPMVVLEAMAAGLPVIATSVEGTPEAIRHRQEGLLAEPGSSGSLAAQITCLVQGDVAWEDLSLSAIARHAANFSDRAMARGVAGVYERVLGNTE